jgi:hypothetical protein
MRPLSRRGRLVAALALAAAAAAGNVAREAWWTQADGFVSGPFARPYGDRVAAMPVTGLTRVEVPAPSWRPLSLAVRVDGGVPVRVSVGTAGGGVSIAPGASMDIRAEAAAATPDRVVVWAEAALGTTGASLRVDGVRPLMAARPIALAVATGLLVGAVLGWAIAGAAADAAAPPVVAATPPERLSLAAPIAILAIVHGAWIVLKPPLQSPDEPQHHARATSMPAAPYVAGGQTITIADAHRNPLTWTPNRLHAIIFQPGQHLSADDVRDLRAAAWPPSGPDTAGSYPAGHAIPSPIASYPPLYYGVAFAGGELVTSAFGLSPWSSLLAYRLVSVLAAGVLWCAVYVLLRRTPFLGAHALPAFVLLVATPTTAAITSSVNADAMAIPAGALLLLTAWRRLAAGGSDAAVIVSALLALATKPSGLLVVGGVGVATAAWMWRRPTERAGGRAVLRALAGTSAAAFALFYAWSPPRVLPAPGPDLGLAGYLTATMQRLPPWWEQYWGRLGWLEYGAPTPLYWLLLALCVVLAILARRSTPDEPAPDGFLLIAAAGYGALLLAGEYVHLRDASLVVQGRYFLPVSMALVPLVRQRSRALAWALPALLMAMHVALAQAAVVRYFGGDWALWWRSIG